MNNVGNSKITTQKVLINDVNKENKKINEQKAQHTQIEDGEKKLALCMDALAAYNKNVNEQKPALHTDALETDVIPSRESFDFEVLFTKKDYNENGTIKSKTTLFTHKEYDEFGDLKSKEILSSGKKTEYYKSGLKKSVEYANGEKVNYSPDGNLDSKEFSDGSKQIYRTMHGSDTRYVAMEIAADGSEKHYSPQGELLEEYTAEEAKVKPQMVEPYDKEGKNCK